MTSTTATAAAVTFEQLLAVAVAMGTDETVARRVIEATPEEHYAAIFDSFQAAIAENAAFRERLVASPDLMRAVSPAPSWRTAADRRDVAKRAVNLIEAFIAGRPQAIAAGITAEQVGEQLVKAEGTVWGGMTMHPDKETGEAHDPRLQSWGHAFYGFRYRVTEALDILLADELKAEATRKRDAQDAAWARRGLKRCERCDGQGGRKDWPGFTCYDCDGHGAV